MKRKICTGDLIFTKNCVVDFYFLSEKGSKIYKLIPRTALLICDASGFLYSKISDEMIIVGMDVNVWIPVFYFGMTGWIHKNDIDNFYAF